MGRFPWPPSLAWRRMAARTIALAESARRDHGGIGRRLASQFAQLRELVGALGSGLESSAASSPGGRSLTLHGDA
jgi:hypothetical protein